MRIAAEHDEREISGFVVTFDDITELLSAQRKAAWADVARRIAHEIKNPLTPIQLSAERLQRNYLKEIKNDPETFTICTDTIIRHVGDIGRMVDEFSSFARMPAPVLKPEDLAEIVRPGGVPAAHRASARSRSRRDLPATPVTVRCDARLVGQALINIVKNAVEAIEARIVEQASRAPGHICVSVDRGDGQAARDRRGQRQGPAAGRARAPDRALCHDAAKGTGLGLAIVKKIMEDHRGRADAGRWGTGGARVRLVFATEARDDRNARTPPASRWS